MVKGQTNQMVKRTSERFLKISVEYKFTKYIMLVYFMDYPVHLSAS